MLYLATVVAKSNISAWNFALPGNIDRAYKTSLEALKLAEDSDDIYSKGAAYGSHGLSCYCKGLLDEAMDHLEKGLAYCGKIKQLSWQAMSSFFLWLLYADLKDYKNAHQYYTNSISILNESKLLPSWIEIMSLCLAGARTSIHNQDIISRDLFEHYKAIKIKSLEGWKARVVGEIFLNIDGHHKDEAGEWIEKAIEADERNGMMWHLAMDYASYAEVIRRKGDQLRAGENLSTAIKIFKERGADGWVKKYEKQLAELRGS